MNNSRPFSVSLKALRVNAKLSLERAAEAIGVTVPTLRSWENGKTFPDFRQMQEICRVYNCGIDNIRFIMSNDLADSEEN